MGGWLVLVVLVVASLALTAVIRLRDGRARSVPDGLRIADDELGVALGSAATFVQFSSPTCTPCRGVRRVLGALAVGGPEVVHVELDVERHGALVRRHRVHSTPTVLVLDDRGTVRQRLTGAVDRPAALRALAAVAPGAADATSGPAQGTPEPSTPPEVSRA